MESSDGKKQEAHDGSALEACDDSNAANGTPVMYVCLHL